MSTTEHYGKSTTASLPAWVQSTTARYGPYKGPTVCRGAHGLCREKTSLKVCRSGPKPSGPWPPAHLTLSDTLEGIEAGRVAQRSLFPPVPDDSKVGRLRRLLGTEKMK
jgi:hypothetical protein